MNDLIIRRKKCLWMPPCLTTFAATLVIFCASVWAEPRSLLILHTNDLHDHVRADYDGAGGMAYVAGYIQGVKASRDDVLVFDAGDVMEKGDLVTFRSKSTIMYEAIAQAGYDAIAPGNHDDAYGDEHLVDCAALATGVKVLAINLTDDDGKLVFAPSAIFQRNGLEIGVIGVFKPRDENALSLDETIKAVVIEANRLEYETDLIIVVAHLGVQDCRSIATSATNVDVFVTGHTHQAIKKPIVQASTGALFVQAGSNAEYVGRLELSVDDESGEIFSAIGELIPMQHATVSHDAALQRYFTDQEALLASEANDFVVNVDRTVGFMDLAYLGAEGIRRHAGADLAFCHGSQIIRDSLHPGPADVNAIFRTGGQRGHDIVQLELTGAEIDAYVEGLLNSDWGKTHWSGFSGSTKRVNGRRVFLSNLNPNHRYTVAMPLKEWDTRFRRFFERESNSPYTTRILGLEPTPIMTNFTDGVVTILRLYDGSPHEIAQMLREASSLD